MIVAYVLIQNSVGQSGEVLAGLHEVPGVLLAEQVIGPYDVIVRAEAESMSDLGTRTLAAIQAIPGITRTVTCTVVNY